MGRASDPAKTMYVGSAGPIAFADPRTSRELLAARSLGGGVLRGTADPATSADDVGRADAFVRWAATRVLRTLRGDLRTACRVSRRVLRTPHCALLGGAEWAFTWGGPHGRSDGTH